MQISHREIYLPKTNNPHIDGFLSSFFDDVINQHKLKKKTAFKSVFCDFLGKVGHLTDLPMFSQKISKRFEVTYLFCSVDDRLLLLDKTNLKHNTDIYNQSNQ